MNRISRFCLALVSDVDTEKTNPCVSVRVAVIILMLVGSLPCRSHAEVKTKPAYTEAELASEINFYVKRIKDQLEVKRKADPGKYTRRVEVFLDADECPEVGFLAWMIIAAGEHYNGSEELKHALFRVRNDVGWLPVPSSITWEEQREKMVKYFMLDRSSNPSETNPFASNHLYWLALEAAERITVRTGFQFEGYNGLELLSRP